MAESTTPESLAAEALARWRRGEGDAARSAAADALASRPGLPPALAVQGFCARASGDDAGCRAAFAALGLPEADPRIVELVFQLLAEGVREGRALFGETPAPSVQPPPLTFTVVTCSREPARLAQCQARWRAALPAGFEFIGIAAPRSLAGAYQDAAERATGEAIVFLHDDVEILTPRLDLALARVLAHADIAGIAGTRELAGPTLGWAGQAPMSGWLVHGGSAAATWDFSLLALRGGILAGMQALDGCFLAARTEVARAVGFDARTFDAFHFYDLDFCLRAQRAGHAVAVTTEVLAAHASRGRLGFAWEAQARRFREKFPPLGQVPARPSHFHAAALSGAGEALRLHAELNGFCRAIGAYAG